MVGPTSAQEFSSTTGLNVRLEPRAACGTSVSTARLGGRLRQLIGLTRSVLQNDIFPFNVAKLFQFPPERLDTRSVRCHRAQETQARNVCLLRLGGNAKRNEHSAKI